jgi:hypothetical protein
VGYSRQEDQDRLCCTRQDVQKRVKGCTIPILADRKPSENLLVGQGDEILQLNRGDEVMCNGEPVSGRAGRYTEPFSVSPRTYG